MSSRIFELQICDADREVARRTPLTAEDVTKFREWGLTYPLIESACRAAVASGAGVHSYAWAIACIMGRQPVIAELDRIAPPPHRMLTVTTAGHLDTHGKMDLSGAVAELRNKE